MNYKLVAKVLKYAETTEDDFQKLLDQNINDHHTRLILADWLQEHNDPRAEGYRALGLLQRIPHTAQYTDFGYHNGSGTNYPEEPTVSAKHSLPKEWINEITGNDRIWTFPFSDTRKEEEDRAALAFAKLPPELKDNILKGEYKYKCKTDVIRYSTTEQDFHDLLDQNPDDHQTRLILADWLQEQDDPRAEGYRALGKLRHRPQMTYSFRKYWHSPNYAHIHHLADKNPKAIILPIDWFDNIKHDREYVGAGIAGFDNRKQAEDAAALAFSQLPEERRKELLS